VAEARGLARDSPGGEDKNNGKELSGALGKKSSPHKGPQISTYIILRKTRASTDTGPVSSPVAKRRCHIAAHRKLDDFTEHSDPLKLSPWCIHDALLVAAGALAEYSRWGHGRGDPNRKASGRQLSTLNPGRARLFSSEQICWQKA